MLALYRAGRQAEALREYQQFRKLLDDIAGGVTAYVAQQNEGDIARGRTADIARLQGQADAYLSELATERGRAADAQRMQAYADWWLGTHR
jgi:hypothetical protein